jgi:hypothetical protein
MAQDLGDQALAEEEALGHSMAMAEALTDALAQLDAKLRPCRTGRKQRSRSTEMRS